MYSLHITPAEISLAVSVSVTALMAAVIAIRHYTRHHRSGPEADA